VLDYSNNGHSKPSLIPYRVDVDGYLANLLLNEISINGLIPASSHRC